MVESRTFMHKVSAYIYIYIDWLIDDYYNQEIFKKKSQSIIINVTFYWKIIIFKYIMRWEREREREREKGPMMVFEIYL